MSSPIGPVLILGAGATKACLGPLTNEILFESDRVAQNFQRQDYVTLVDGLLTNIFRLPPKKVRVKTSYPGLPLLMSLIDTAIDRGQPLGLNHDVATLREVRAAIEYTIFAVLEYKLRGDIPQFHVEAINRLFPKAMEPRLISLNYDIIADNTLARRSPESFPDYGCEIQTDAYRTWPKFGKLLKLHGSLNWLYCPNCHRLDVAVSGTGHTFSKALQALFNSPNKEGDLDQRYSSGGGFCKNCKTVVRPVMITPTQKKDYRNPHIAQVWYKAEEMLRSASSVVFVGYSMPADDVEVIYLFKRGLAHLTPQQIAVVESDDKNRSVDEHDVGQRYQSVFGQGIQWHTCGFEGWLKETAKRQDVVCKGVPPPDRRKPKFKSNVMRPKKWVRRPKTSQRGM